MIADGRDVVIQLIGFLGVAFFFFSYQVKSNKGLFLVQTLGCLTFSLQFALLGAYSGCLSLLVNIVRNTMLTKYNESSLVRWKGWAVIFSAAPLGLAFLTWDGPLSLLPVAGSISGTIGCWTNNAKKIRMANLFVNAPCYLIYDVIVKSWGGVMNEGMSILAIVVSIIRFGWSALDGDRIEA